MLTFKQKIGYACGDWGCTYLNALVMGMWMFYATNMVGIPLAAVGTLMFLCRFWDAINDIVIGALVDRTHTKTGKARPWLKAHIIPAAITAWIMFALPKGLPVAVKIIWASLGYAAYTWCYTAINLSYGAMMVLMTRDNKDRATLSMFRYLGAYIGVFSAQALFLPAVAFIGDRLFSGDRTYAYTIMVGVFAILGVIILYRLYYWCHETVYLEGLKEDEERGITLEDRKKQDRAKGIASIGKDLSYLVRNGPWLIVFGIMFFFWVLSGIAGTPNMYFLIYYIKIDETWSSILNTLGLIPSIVILPFIPKIIGKFGYKKAGIFCMSVSALRYVICFFLGTNIIAITALNTIAQLFQSITMVTGLAMLAEALEYGDLKFDRRLEGIGTAAYSFSTKAGPAVGTLVATLLLSAAGMDTTVARGGDQPEDAIAMLRFLMFILPAVLAGLQAILYAFYPLTKEKYADIIKQIEERNKKRSAEA
jgi:GPH family glycoside/pentoside/hexuronide:cation symporter